MKPTLEKIAQEAGVSTSTASRVATGKGYVKPETRKRIQQVMERYEYSYRNPTKTVGKDVLVLCGDIQSRVYTEYIRGISSVLDDHGYRIFIVDSEYDGKKEERYLRYALKGHFAGVFMLSAIYTPQLINIIKAAQSPIVFLNRHIKSLESDIVCVDNYRCGYLATERLINEGHRRILHLGGPENSTTCNDRLMGYTDCMKDNGLDIAQGDVFRGELHKKSGEEFADFVRENKPDCTAVFSANDLMAIGFVDRLMSRRIAVPGNISIICADDTEAAREAKVALTTISYDPFTMGEAAASLLLERFEDPNGQKKKIMYFPEINERESVAKYKKR